MSRTESDAAAWPLSTFWRDEHGHLYKVVGTSSVDGVVEGVTLTWVEPPMHQKLTFRQLKARFARANPPEAS